MLLSHPMNGIRDVIYGASVNPFWMNKGDELIINCDATRNHEYGVTVCGWAVSGT